MLDKSAKRIIKNAVKHAAAQRGLPLESIGLEPHGGTYPTRGFNIAVAFAGAWPDGVDNTIDDTAMDRLQPTIDQLDADLGELLVELGASKHTRGWYRNDGPGRFNGTYPPLSPDDLPDDALCAEHARPYFEQDRSGRHRLVRYSGWRAYRTFAVLEGAAALQGAAGA